MPIKYFTKETIRTRASVKPTKVSNVYWVTREGMLKLYPHKDTPSTTPILEKV